MPSILSGCLILLKIAMAVNEGLHSMLSSIYSIIENVLSSDDVMEPVQETDSVPVVHCSKSRILEAFNRRRANLPIFEQTEVYVSNMNPYQEITITNKDYDLKRRRSSSSVEKSQSKCDENPLNPHGVQGNEDICSTCPGNFQSSTPSLVSSDTGNESEYQSCKTLNGSVELEDNIVNICAEDESGNTNNMLDASTDEETSTEADQSPDSSFLKVLQSQIKFISQTLQRALPNVKNPSTENVCGLTDSESTDNNEIASAEVCTSSSLGVPACHPATSHWQVNESRELQQKHDYLPSITISDYSSVQSDTNCPGGGYSSDCKQVSERPATKRIDTYQLPLSLQNDRWIEMEDFDQSKIEDSKKLYQNADSLKRDALIPSEHTDVNQSLGVEESPEEISSSEDGNIISVDVLEECQSPIKRNSHRRSFNLKEFNYANELDIDSLERVRFLVKVLKLVGAAEVLEESNVEHPPEKSMFNNLSEVESSYPEKFPLEEPMNISSPVQTDLLDVDHIPLKELDTEEKQIIYLDKLTENCTKRLRTMVSKQKSIQEIESEFLDELGGECHKIMLDKITNGYKHQLDSITRNAGMCLNELYLIDSDLKTKFGFSNFKQGASSTENCLENCASLRTSTSVGEIHASGLSFLLPKEHTTEPLKLVENEQMCETSLKNEVNGLLETGNSGAIFTLDSERNETSTPKQDEEIEDHIWVTRNLFSESQNEQSVNEGNNLISSLFDSKLRRNILGSDLDLALFDGRQEMLFSENVMEDISIEAEDWRNITAQMSKNYENVVSLLDIIDDGENASLKKEFESKLPENEDSNGKTDTIESEKVLNCDCAPKEQAEASITGTEETNMSGESNSDIVNTSNEVSSRELLNLLPNGRATVEQRELETKECLRMDNFVNENASFKTPEEQQMESYNYPEPHLKSTNNVEETKLKVLKPTNVSQQGLKSLVIRSKSNSNSENEENCSRYGKSTPISNMEDLLKREELETVQIYDGLQVCDKVEHGSISDDLSGDDSNHNLGS